MTRDDTSKGPLPAHQRCQDLLSAYLDGQLDEPTRRDVAGHLDACPECRVVAEELDAIRHEARTLGPVEPARDLWPGIRSRLDEAEVVPLPVAGPQPSPFWRRVVRLTVPQLAAAGLVLALGAGAGAWAVRPVVAPAPSSQAAAPDGVRMIAGGANGVEAMGAAESLEAILREARDRLDPNTVRILEKNLAVIQRAIDEARAALEVDPGNTFLEGYLEATLARRTQYLQETRALLDWSS